MRRLIGNIHVFWALLAVPAMIYLWRLTASGFDPALAFDLEHGTGELSVRLMIAAMAVSPLRAILGRRGWTEWLMQRRRAIGVAAFGYGALHLMVYLIDFEAFSGGIDLVIEDAAQFSIWTGYAALAIMFAMALTSNNSAQKIMKRHWKRLQRLVYGAAILVAIHWVFVDNEWRAAAAHFIPLLILEIARLVLSWRKRRFNSGSWRQGNMSA
ncbi:MAG: ferric reductase-like transmembrane domain-containing protein [Pseudomonadota bacterium]